MKRKQIKQAKQASQSGNDGNDGGDDGDGGDDDGGDGLQRPSEAEFGGNSLHPRKYPISKRCFGNNKKHKNSTQIQK